MGGRLGSSHNSRCDCDASPRGLTMPVAIKTMHTKEDSAAAKTSSGRIGEKRLSSAIFALEKYIFESTRVCHICKRLRTLSNLYELMFQEKNYTRTCCVISISHSFSNSNDVYLFQFVSIFNC